MTAHGATENSRTQSEFTKLLGQDAEGLVATSKEVADLLKTVNSVAELKMANGLWAHSSIKDEYKSQMKTVWDAEIDKLTTKEVINDWIEKHTGGMIKDVVDDIDPLVRLILANAVYFKGSWAKQFDPEQTHPGTFTTFDKEVPCDMMSQEDKFMMLETENATVLALPYDKDFKVYAILMLPHQKGPEALQAVVADFAANPLLLKDMRKQKVLLEMPRFKMDTKESLENVLSALGLETPFRGEQEGAFNNMSDDKKLYISSVTHAASCEVTEEGTVAAAATVMAIQVMSMPLPPALVTFDRPFLFAILADKTVAFVGRVAKPDFMATPQLTAEL